MEHRQSIVRAPYTLIPHSVQHTLGASPRGRAQSISIIYNKTYANDFGPQNRKTNKKRIHTQYTYKTLAARARGKINNYLKPSSGVMSVKCIHLHHPLLAVKAIAPSIYTQIPTPSCSMISIWIARFEHKRLRGVGVKHLARIG